MEQTSVLVLPFNILLILFSCNSQSIPLWTFNTPQILENMSFSVGIYVPHSIMITAYKQDRKVQKFESVLNFHIIWLIMLEINYIGFNMGTFINFISVRTLHFIFLLPNIIIMFHMFS